MTARIVYLDIERQSGIVDGIWELKQRSWLSPHQILERPRTICFAWRWDGDTETHFSAEWDRGGHKAMIAKAHKVMDEADFIVGNVQNGHTEPLRADVDRAIAGIEALSHDVRGLRQDMAATDDLRRQQITELRSEIEHRAGRRKP